MTVQLTGTGGWGTRIGKDISEFNRVDVFRGSELDVVVSSINSEYQTHDQIVVDNLFTNKNSYRQIHISWLGVIQQIANQTTTEQVDRDSPLLNKTLDSALVELIQQLKDNGSYTQRHTLTATPAAVAGNLGNATLIASVTDPADGGVLDYSFSEVITFTCTTDSGTGAVAFQESFQAVGDPQAGETDYNWPAGSGATATLTVIDGSASTLVSDGSFENWNNNTPTAWTIVTGAATITHGCGTTPLRGLSCLHITSDGSTQTRLRSAPVSLAPLTTYVVSLAARIDTPAAGSLVVKLVDDLGNTLADVVGTLNQLALDTSSDLSASYQIKTAWFRTDKSLPTTAYLDIHLATPPASPRAIDIDLLAFVQAAPLYAGGPYAAIVAGSAKSIVGDRYTLTVANAATSASFQRGANRLFQLRQKGLKLPSTTGFAVLHDGLTDPLV